MSEFKVIKKYRWIFHSNEPPQHRESELFDTYRECNNDRFRRFGDLMKFQNSICGFKGYGFKSELTLINNVISCGGMTWEIVEVFQNVKLS